MEKQTVVLQNLSIGYRMGKKTRVIADGLHASLYGGELTCLIGTNGVGKSTLLRTLSFFQPPLEGKVLPLSGLSTRQLAKWVSVVLTDRIDVSDLTVHELIGIGRSPYTNFWGTLSPKDEEVVEEALRLVGIFHLRDRMIHTLSDGERQKAMVAKALAQQTPIILLDEPTAFLDFPSKVEMLQNLRQLAHDLNKTIFLSTHDVELALQLADKLWLMERVTGTEKKPQTIPTSRLQVGTPRELAETGALSHFIERKGILFDKTTLTMRVDK